MQQAPQLAVVNGAGQVAMVRGQDGALALPALPGWDGEAVTFAGAVSRQLAAGHDLPAVLRAGLTHLTPLSSGGNGAAVVSLAETWDADLAVDAWWAPGSPLPHGMPPEAQPGLLTAALAATEEENPSAPDHWPFFCLPGATETIRGLLEGDETARALASLSLQPHGDGRGDRDLLQVQGWPLSSVWRNDDVVLKIANPAWRAEPRLTAELAGIAPGTVPEVISHGDVTGRGGTPTAYLLQRRVLEPEPGSDAVDKVHRSVTALQSLAALQLDARAHGGRLRGAGVLDRDPLRTSGELPRLWQVVAPGLSDDERTALPELDRQLRAGLERLARTPTLVVHGDLHLGNVLEDRQGEPQLIDWTDAAFAWPGVDLYTILNRLEPDARLRESVTAAYVAALGGEFEEAVRLGLQLAPTYHALSYQRISDFLPRVLAGSFSDVVTRLVRHQFEVMSP